MPQPRNVYLVSRQHGGGQVVMVQANTPKEASEFWRGEVQETIRVDTLPLSGFTVTEGPGEVVPAILGIFSGDCNYEGATMGTNYFVFVPDLRYINKTGLSLLQQAELGVSS